MSCERHPDERKCGCRANRKSSKTVEHQKGDLVALVVEIILDDDLNPERHVIGARQHKEEHQNRIDGFGEIGGDRALFGTDISERRGNEPERERNERDRRHALMPKMQRACSGGAETFDLGERRAEVARSHTPHPALTIKATMKATTA